MAFKGTAGKSSSGASMSKYDVEVEARLKKLEATVSEVVGMVSALETSVDGLKSHSHDAPPVATVDVGAVVAALKAQWPNKFTDL